MIALLSNNNDHACVHLATTPIGATDPDSHSMTTLAHADHAIRRKSYAPHYIPANLALFEPELHDFSLKLTEVVVIHPEQPT